MSSFKHVSPTAVRLESPSELVIQWSDGLTSRVSAYRLRQACRCAMCVDEQTGKSLMSPNRMDPHVTVQQVRPVGRYAVAFQFSDGHATGIYTFDLLRSLQNDEAPSS